MENTIQLLPFLVALQEGGFQLRNIAVTSYTTEYDREMIYPSVTIRVEQGEFDMADVCIEAHESRDDLSLSVNHQNGSLEVTAQIRKVVEMVRRGLKLEAELAENEKKESQLLADRDRINKELADLRNA